MKSILQQIAEETRQQERGEAEAIKAEIANPETTNDRRNFLKKAALGGIALGGLTHLSIEDTVAQTTQKVSRASSPSDLRITDLRFAEKMNVNDVRLPSDATIDRGSNGWAPTNRIIKIYTNQGITGLGDIRDMTDQRLAGMLKRAIVGLNPCNVEMLFNRIKQFGGHGTLGGGVAAVEMACWDIAGKAFGVPVWMLLGGRYRDKIRLYADTRSTTDPVEQLEHLRHRMDVQKFTWLKMDLRVTSEPRSVIDTIPLPTGVSRHQQITDEGMEIAAEKVAKVREMTGPDIPISTDHYGSMDLNQFIRLGRAVDKYRLAWLEDPVSWRNTDQLRQISEAVETPILTGENIYLLEGEFKKLIDAHAVDIIHPDLVSAGGILETKKIGDYAQAAGIPVAIHNNSSPVMFIAGIHSAAATQNVLVMEHHHADYEWWDDLIIKTDSIPLWADGFGNVPLNAPGLGIELNDEIMKAHMAPGKVYFEPTPEWD